MSKDEDNLLKQLTQARHVQQYRPDLDCVFFWCVPGLQKAKQYRPRLFTFCNYMYLINIWLSLFCLLTIRKGITYVEFNIPIMQHFNVEIVM